MSNNLPRKPVRFQAHNDELLKSMGTDYSSVKDASDYVQDEAVATLPPGVQHNYRTPSGRVDGNAMFRRYLNGKLDIDYACQQVIDAVHRVKENAAPLFAQESLALQVVFPGHFGETVDPLMAGHMASVNLSLIPEEVALIRLKVARHLAEEMNWNAGQGGGSVDGRNQTRS